LRSLGAKLVLTEPIPLKDPKTGKPNMMHYHNLVRMLSLKMEQLSDSRACVVVARSVCDLWALDVRDRHNSMMNGEKSQQTRCLARPNGCVPSASSSVCMLEHVRILEHKDIDTCRCVIQIDRRIQIDGYRQTDTDRQIQTDRYRQTDTDRRIQTDRYRQTDTDRQTQTDRYRQTDTYRQIQTDRYRQPDTDKQTH
jgi:hypothetical protein